MLSVFVAKKMSSRKRNKDADEELARQLQDEELARQLELELLQLDIEELDPAVWPHASSSSAISSNSKKPIPGNSRHIHAFLQFFFNQSTGIATSSIVHWPESCATDLKATVRINPKATTMFI